MRGQQVGPGILLLISTALSIARILRQILRPRRTEAGVDVLSTRLVAG